jgi:hypothetical protein
MKPIIIVYLQEAEEFFYDDVDKFHSNREKVGLFWK